MKTGEKNNHSCFEWIHLVISFSIPVAIVIYTVLENNRDLAIAAYNRAQDLEIADNQQQDTILQEYKKSLSKLIENYGLQLNESASVSLAAHFLTLSALKKLDPSRRNFLIGLLYDTQLITYHSISDRPAISLELTNLTELCLIDGSIRQTLTHVSMQGAIMTRANFHGINMHGAIFTGAKLDNADFSNTTNVWLCDFMSCLGFNSPSLYFENTDLTNTSFFGAIHENVTFKSSKMRNTNLHSFECILCDFTFAVMVRVDLRNAKIERSSFTFVTLTESNLHGSRFRENVDFYGAIMKFVNATHTYFTQCQFEHVSLMNTTFDYTTIEDSTFLKAQLLGISIRHSVFINVNFTNANLREGNWQNVRCERCIFDGADFNYTDISNAIFIDSDFRNSIISEEQLNQAASLNGSILPNGTVINYR